MNYLKKKEDNPIKNNNKNNKINNKILNKFNQGSGRSTYRKL